MIAERQPWERDPDEWKGCRIPTPEEQRAIDALKKMTSSLRRLSADMQECTESIRQLSNAMGPQ